MKGLPRVLFLMHEQRRLYWEEPGYTELYLPMVNSGLLGEVRSFAYQRDIRALMHAAPALGIPGGKEHQFANANLLRILDETFREFRPDLVVYSLTWPSEAIMPQVFTRLRETHRFRLVSVIWDYDESSQALMDYDRGIIAASDMAVVADSSWRAGRIRSRSGPYAGWEGVDKVAFLPMVADPDLFAPSPHKRHDVTVAGSSEGARVEIVEGLRAAGIPVNRVGGMAPGDEFLGREAYARAMAESRIVVNTQTRPERIQIKGRVGQALAAGTFLLEQWSPEGEAFLEGIPAEMWRTVPECVDKVVHWLARDAEREARAAEARRIYLGRHDRKRFTRIVLGDG